MFRSTRLGVGAVAVALWLSATGAVASAGSSAPPATVTAVALASSDSGSSYAHRGRPVRSTQLGARAFVDARHGFALAGTGGAQYPASTTNGGATWRIDGPHFHVNAADAPDVVTRIGVAGNSTYFAYAGPGGGQSVVVSTDRGVHWWRAYMPGVPLAVEPTGGGKRPALVAIVEIAPGKFAAYMTSDGGHHWKHHPGFI